MTPVMGFRLILFLYIEGFLQNQPDLRLSLKLFLKTTVSIATGSQRFRRTGMVLILLCRVLQYHYLFYLKPYQNTLH